MKLLELTTTTLMAMGDEHEYFTLLMSRGYELVYLADIDTVINLKEELAQ